MKKIQKGFTLIELMIVVAIIGILAAIAIPAYQDYTIRAQVTEGLNLMSDMKAGVAEWYAQEGSWPTSLVQIGVSGGATDKSGKYVERIELNTGTLTAFYGLQANSKINGSSLSLRPLVNANGDVVWVCGQRVAPTGAADPSGTAAAGSANTSLAGRYLPASCRSSGGGGS
jgi:type IV pilus assembly protein PilA